LNKIITLVFLLVVLNQGFKDEPGLYRSGINHNNQNLKKGLPAENTSSSSAYFIDSLNRSNDTNSLKSSGYLIYYRGGGQQSGPVWFTGIDTNHGGPFNSYEGPDSGYLAANYSVVSGINNIDSWLVLPRQNVLAGDSLSFFSRSSFADTSVQFVDSITVMYNPAGDSIPEASSWIKLDSFKVNKGFWEKKGFRASQSGANGRFAIRYKVAESGPLGSNGDYIGIDLISIVRSPVFVNENITGIPGKFILYQNYPNPFNPSTTIKYKIAEQSIVKIRVYDVYGRETAILVNKEQNPGEYIVKFDGEKLSSGIYFYKMETGNKKSNSITVKKMLLIK
jgi:hypothetical protein